MRKSIHDWMASVDEEGGPSIDALKKPIYEAPDPDLVANVERCFLFSFLLGMDHASSSLDMADGTWEPITFEEAVSFMKARVPLTKNEWTPLEEKLRFRAFTVAALSEPDAIERIRGQLLNTLETGSGVKELWNTAKLEDVAGIGQNPHYWENVYRTNIQTAYNAGRAAEFMRNQPEYITLVGVEDLRQTDICYSLTHNPVVLPASHPFWKTHWPPFHFRCRTTVRGMYPEEVEAMREDGSFDKTDETALQKVVKPAKGFGGNPIDSGSYWELTDPMAIRAIKNGIMPYIEKLSKDLGVNGIRLHNSIDDKNYHAIDDSDLVLVSKVYGKKIPKKEADIASRIATEDRKVKILPLSNSLRSPDFMIDGVVWEAKTAESASPSAIDSLLREASRQSENVILVLPVDQVSSEIRYAINDRVSRDKSRRIEKIMILTKKEMQIYERAELLTWRK